MPAAPLAPYDALVLLSFGGPEGMPEVMPFLRRVTAGRGIPEERLAEVAEHYARFGGVSPINAQNRALVAALDAELARRGIAIPVHLANRNSPPYVRDVLAGLAPARLLTILTSPYQSYSSCRQYREDLGVAAEGLDITVDKLPPYAAHPPFVEAVTAAVLASVRDALAARDDTGASATSPGTTDAAAAHSTDAAAAHPTDGTAAHPTDGAHPRQDLALICVAHSIPEAADAAAGRPETGGHAYARGLAAMAETVTAAVNTEFGLDLTPDLAWCSRSGAPHIPWLEPDILDRLDAVAGAGARTVVVAPIGFVSDHLEVVYDLDTEAREHALGLGLDFHRAATVGTDPAFVAGLVDLALARATAARHATDEAQPDGTAIARDLNVLAALPPADCPPDCCRSQRPVKPTRCGREDPR
ncbi:ferrochelatase [Nostocoides vanveenii]|uniref:Coproporphyrin III ferrochelatase n=1 Tax=Nostocoides vanveenii TaxID=330835 RepID=A0ABN2L5R7_9MICO